MMSEPFPFTAIVGQDDMKLAMILAAIDPSIGGVLAFGDRGSGKSTAVRALAALLPEIRVVVGCPYSCDPKAPAGLCEACKGAKPKTALRAPLVVDLPLGATEDRVVGALDLERALAHGERHSSRACSPARIAASSTSTRRTCWRTISSISCSTSRRAASMWWSARACRCAIPPVSC
jgi:Mg-chelatase subunit ChlI